MQSGYSQKMFPESKRCNCPVQRRKKIQPGMESGTDQRKRTNSLQDISYTKMTKRMNNSLDRRRCMKAGLRCWRFPRGIQQEVHLARKSALMDTACSWKLHEKLKRSSWRCHRPKTCAQSSTPAHTENSLPVLRRCTLLARTTAGAYPVRGTTCQRGKEYS